MLGLLAAFFILFALGVTFFGYALIVGLALFALRGVYLFFNKNKPVEKPSSTEVKSGNVEVGYFDKGPGRIIDHDDP